MARIGEIIDGKYEILSEVGRGGMSVVYLAMDKRLNKQWAIKEFRKDKDDDSKQRALEALLREANLMKKLDHPTLPRITDIIEDAQTVYVIMDYIEGESLNKVLDAYGPQPQEAVIEWAKQLCDVLDYLHTQDPPVIYRDMKPANIMLKPNGTVQLIDFGIAREYKEGQVGDTESLGTRGYAAPEMFSQDLQSDARSDIYCLGVTLYHLVTGKSPAEPPYEIYPIRHWNPNLSSALEWVIEKCTQLNPNDRFQSCAEITYVLENLSTFDDAVIRKRKRKLRVFLATAASALVVGLVSAGCFVGSTADKDNSFNDLIASEQYVEALSINDTDPHVYDKLIDQISVNVVKIESGNPSSKTVDFSVDSVITDGDISSWFSSERMQFLKETDPAVYAKVQFRLGYAMWEKYDNSDINIVAGSVMKYFREVIDVANSNVVDQYAGLPQKQFNLAKILYQLNFFQININKFKENSIGDKYELTEEEANRGFNKELFDQSPYLCYWDVMDQVVDMLVAAKTDDDMITPAVKVETYKRLAVVLKTSYSKFYSDVPSGDISDLYEKLLDTLGTDKSLNKVDGFEEIYSSIKDSLAKSIRDISNLDKTKSVEWGPNAKELASKG